jgi:SHS2 domain-containing protein
MSYTYLDDIVLADVAFLAYGKTLEELFIAAADAVMNVMVDDLATIRARQEFFIDVTNGALDLLLFDFLNEIVYLKDARRLLSRVKELRIIEKNSLFTLRAEAYGEEVDPDRHPIMVDVKAVTLHRFTLKQTEEGWEAMVILDV